MASAVISVFPQHLYRALHFPLDKWALHNGRFFCLPERSRGSQRPEKEPVALSICTSWAGRMARVHPAAGMFPAISCIWENVVFHDQDQPITEQTARLEDR